MADILFRLFFGILASFTGAYLLICVLFASIFDEEVK